MRKRSIIWSYDKEDVRRWIETCSTYGEVLGKFGLCNKGNNFQTLQRFLDYHDIDYSGLVNRRNKKRVEGMHNKNLRPLDSVLTTDSNYGRRSLRQRLIKAGLLNNQCYECGQDPYWNNKPLVLQLDHKNGNNTDNRLENLRLLCPNCHTQTPTFAGRNPCLLKRNCVGCNSLLAQSVKGDRCNKCFDRSAFAKNLPNRHRKVQNRPSKEELKKLIAQKSWTAIGKDYGVSDNAVKKWATGYGITWIKRPYNRKNQEVESQILRD